MAGWLRMRVQSLLLVGYQRVRWDGGRGGGKGYDYKANSSDLRVARARKNGDSGGEPRQTTTENRNPGQTGRHEKGPRTTLASLCGCNAGEAEWSGSFEPITERVQVRLGFRKGHSANTDARWLSQAHSRPIVSYYYPTRVGEYHYGVSYPNISRNRVPDFGLGTPSNETSSSDADEYSWNGIRPP